jgi:hypothetical protein
VTDAPSQSDADPSARSVPQAGAQELEVCALHRALAAEVYGSEDEARAAGDYQFMLLQSLAARCTPLGAVRSNPTSQSGILFSSQCTGAVPEREFTPAGCMPLDPETALAAMDLRLFCRYMAGLRVVLRDPAEHTALAPEALQRVQRLVGAWRAYILPFVSALLAICQ